MPRYYQGCLPPHSWETLNYFSNRLTKLEKVKEMEAMKPLYVIGRKCRDGTVEIHKPNEYGTPASHWVTFDKYHSSKPDYRNKYIMLNCYRYHLMWNRN